jgi:hypothetical protein
MNLIKLDIVFLIIFYEKRNLKIFLLIPIGNECFFFTIKCNVRVLKIVLHGRSSFFFLYFSFFFFMLYHFCAPTLVYRIIDCEHLTQTNERFPYVILNFFFFIVFFLFINKNFHLICHFD